MRGRSSNVTPGRSRFARAHVFSTKTIAETKRDPMITARPRKRKRAALAGTNGVLPRTSVRRTPCSLLSVYATNARMTMSAMPLKAMNQRFVTGTRIEPAMRWTFGGRGAGGRRVSRNSKPQPSRPPRISFGVSSVKVTGAVTVMGSLTHGTASRTHKPMNAPNAAPKAVRLTKKLTTDATDHLPRMRIRPPEALSLYDKSVSKFNKAVSSRMAASVGAKSRIRRIAGCAVFWLALAAPAWAQIDLSGQWSGRFHEDQEHRVPGPELGDYLGLPINDAARLKADAWDASILSLREHQAKPHPSTYSLRGPANIRISRVLDAVTQETIGYELFGTFGQATRTIWLDGRPRPPSWAAHTWAGFSLGRWEGDQLTVETTHIKVGWIQRNGVANSDVATMTEHFFRHGDLLTVVTVVKDPVYLEEPFVRSTSWVLDPRQDVVRTQFDVVDEVAGQKKGYVPHLLPGSPGFESKRTEFADKNKLPRAAVRGGAGTTRPEYATGTATNATPAAVNRDASTSTAALAAIAAVNRDPDHPTMMH